MNKNKQEYRVGIGASSMLMIFIILCLTTLSILALSSARTDYAMTERNVKIVEDYYGAVNEAQSVIAQIDGALKKIRDDAQDEAQYEEMLKALSVEGLPVAHEDGRRLSFSIDAGNDSTVDVVLQAAAFFEEGPRYRVVKHALTYIDNWEPEYNLNLYTGGESESPGEADDELEFN